MTRELESRLDEIDELEERFRVLERVITDDRQSLEEEIRPPGRPRCGAEVVRVHFRQHVARRLHTWCPPKQKRLHVGREVTTYPRPPTTYDLPPTTYHLPPWNDFVGHNRESMMVCAESAIRFLIGYSHLK